MREKTTIKLGDAIEKYFYNKYAFDETWADLGIGVLYRRYIEKIKYLNIVNIIKFIKSKNSNTKYEKHTDKIIKKYEIYKEKFELYRTLQEGIISKDLEKYKLLLKEFKIVDDNFNLSNLTADNILDNYNGELLNKSYLFVKDITDRLLKDISDYYTIINLKAEYPKEFFQFYITQNLIPYYEYDLVPLNDKYEEIAKFQNISKQKYKFEGYSNQVFRWFSDEKKKYVKKIFKDFFADLSGKNEIQKSLNKISVDRKFYTEKLEKSARGIYEREELEGLAKQFVDIMILRAVLEIMKLENFVMRKLQKITIKITESNYIKDEYRNIMPGIPLEKNIQHAKDTSDFLDLFYKKNIFDDMIKILNKAIKEQLLNPDDDSCKNFRKGHIAAFKYLRKNFNNEINKNLKPENVNSTYYKYLHKNK